jgi:8-oxo-dGTP pyrophosphatase MutT (NUDIX family)/predicted transcriptional regulator
MEKETHPIQLDILKKLVLNESQRFSDMRPPSVSSVHLTFHIKQLIAAGVVEKTTEGQYRLTTQGKEAASRLDIDTLQVKVEKQGKIGVLVIPSRVHKGVKQFAMQQRLKHPFFGFWGFVTGKIKRGESVQESAARELEEEMGLTGTLVHKAIHHERIYDLADQLLDDKYFFIYTVEDSQGELLAFFDGGHNEWIEEEDMRTRDVFYDMDDLLAFAAEAVPRFTERSYTVEGF